VLRLRDMLILSCLVSFCTSAPIYCILNIMMYPRLLCYPVVSISSIAVLTSYSTKLPQRKAAGAYLHTSLPYPTRHYHFITLLIFSHLSLRIHFYLLTSYVIFFTLTHLPFSAYPYTPLLLFIPFLLT